MAIRPLGTAVAIVAAAAVAVVARSRITADDAPPPAPVRTTAVAPKSMSRPTTRMTIGVVPHPMPTAADAAALIARLPDPQAREALFDRGTAVLPALRQAADSDADPTIRVDAAALAAEIADADADGQTSVTMKLDGVGADAAWAAVARAGRCGVSGLTTIKAGQVVTVDADATPFWSVVTTISGQTGVAPVIDEPPGHSLNLFPVARNWLLDAPHAIVGPYWIGLVGIDRRRSIPLVPGGPAEDDFDVRVVFLPEPRLTLAGVSGFVVDSAVDDLGHDLAPKPIPPLVDRPTGHVVVGHLHYPDHPGRTIRDLTGHVVVVLAEGTRRIRVDHVLDAPVVGNPVDGCQFTAVVARIAGRFRVTVVCERGEMDDERWRSMVGQIDQVELVDAAGKHLRPVRWTASPEATPVHFQATADFIPDGTADPATLFWDVPSRLKPVTVPATFHNLPMP